MTAVDQALAKDANATAKPIISFRNISKRWGSAVAVDNVSLDIMPGEFFALLGPSGCGKTTLLRVLAGLEVPTEGHIMIDGQDMAEIPPNRRAVNMVFQSYAVFPHMSVADNVAYGLKVDGVPQSERDRRVQEALDLVQLGHLAKRMPDQLSGGQRQRVGVARALAAEPRVLLMDEPFGALDPVTRAELQQEFRRIQDRVRKTVIIVTHDMAEALSLADRVVVLDQGAVVANAPPAQILESDDPRVRRMLDAVTVRPKMDPSS